MDSSEDIVATLGQGWHCLCQCLGDKGSVVSPEYLGAGQGEGGQWQL